MKMLYTLILSTLFCLTLGAQTVWTGNVDTDWNNPSNWSAGIPTAGMTVTIPGSTTSGNFPVYSGNPVIDFTIQNAGSITFNDFVYNNGTIINFTAGTLVNNNNYFVNAGSVIFDNDGAFTNTGTFENFGTFDNAASAVFTNDPGAVLINQGLFRNNGLLDNDGTIINNGMIRSTNNLLNDATIDNYGFIENPFGSVVSNNNGASIINNTNSEFSHNGDFQNNGSIENSGKFDIQNASTHTNDGTINNENELQVSGTLLNNSTTTNNGMSMINNAGTLNNTGSYINNGTTTTAICGVIIQNSPNNISGPVIHDGIVYELQGSVDVTIDQSEDEFGVVFNNLSQTKIPIAGCKSGATVVLDANGQGVLDIDLVDKGSYASCGATLVSRELSETDFSTADLGAQNVTLTIEDNLGVTASCDAVIFVVEFVPPLEAIDDEDIEFACPEDITVTPEPGELSVAVNWEEPTEVSTNCAGTEACANRAATNTSQCNTGVLYGFYLKLSGLDYYYTLSNGSFVENVDGTARLTGQIANVDNSDYSFDVDVTLSGRTFSAPTGSPKENSCNSQFDASNWYYYTGTTGTLTGTNDFAGATLTVDRFGEAFQVGNGANATDGNNDFGASGWLTVNVISQPTSGPNLSVNYGSNPQGGDINVMLSGNGSACQPTVQCSDTNNDIPGFIFMGEYNDSKYYCSNSSDFTWSEAKAAAENTGGRLAIVDDQGENDFIQNGIIADDAWIGLSDEQTEGTFVWVDGSSLDYSNWNSGEPNNNGGNEDYTRLLKTNGKWTDRNQHYEAEFVVEIPCSNAAPTCSNISENKPGFTYLGEFNDSKYYVSDHAADWGYAQSNSEVNGGHLVVINDASENNFVVNAINPSSGSVWTGLNTVNSPDVFNWVNGSPVAYTNWQAGEPNGNGINQAARMKKSSGEWTDRSAYSYSYEYVMEIPCDNTPPPPPVSSEAVIEQITGPLNGADFGVGVTEIAYQVTDDCGNLEICIFTVTVEDNPAEITANCPADIVVDAAPGANNASVNWDEPSGTTTCYIPGVEINRTDELAENGGDFSVGVNFVSYALIDSCNNFSSCLLTITVNEVTPVLTLDSCPGDFTTDTDNFTWDIPTASTTCFTGNVEIEQVDGPALGSNPGEGVYQISYLINDDCENSEVCVFDVIVEASCPAAGTPCDDGDDCTTGDEEDGDCNCIGIYTDSDGDGVCDADDICAGGDDNMDSDGDGVPDFCDDCSVAGQPCDDGDACTTGDTYDANCNCAGTFADSDSDGVCDADDVCNGGDDNMDSDGDGVPDFCDDCSVAGQPCDDGDACTTGDTYDANCNCAGTFADSDSDGVCDADDVCNGGDDNMDSDGDGVPDFCDDCSVAGQPCDDGDACTTGDTYDANCNCAGTFADSDSDGVCDADDVCAGGDDNMDSDGDGVPDFCDDCSVAGQPCDDGDACTTGDTYDANCNCAGTFADSDSDGVCDADDVCNGGDDNMDSDGDGIPDFCDDCSVAGQPCDDGDACTTGDTYDANCNCAGTFADSDSDGVCDADDVCNGGDDNMDSDGDGVPDFCDDCSVAGQPCDDGDACTTGDTYDANCNCAGTFADSDNDGVCDADDVCNGGDDNMDSDGDGIPDFCDEPSGDPCEDIVITAGSGSITVSNINAPIFNVFVFNTSWGTEFNCNYACSDPTSIDLAPGTYFVKVSLRDASWQEICEIFETYEVTEGCAFEAGTPCDDGDGCTTGDVYDADCNCAGTFTDSDGDGVCDADDACPGFDDNQDADGDSIPDGCDTNECDNVTNGGLISGDETGCSGYDPTPITSASNPSGGSGTIEYIWLASTTGCPDDTLLAIPGATAPTYDPGIITETTYYLRCSRRSDCTVWAGESNCIIKTVDDTDSDGDGVCDLEDVCAGSDDNVDSDGDGVPDGCDNGDDPCANIQINVGPGSISVSNIDAPIYNIFVFNSSWGTEFNCNYSCTDPTTIDLEPGTYYVKVSLRDASWQEICEIFETYEVTEGCAFEPGTPCDDGDDCTTGDVYDADCNCAGTVADADNDGVCDAEDVCAGSDDNMDSDGDGIPDGCDTNECDNVTDGGQIGGDETGCTGYDPAMITSEVLPSGGSGPVYYIWLSSTSGCPTNLSQTIPGATGATYDPGVITETTYFVRCSRRADCEDWTQGESNCIVKTVDDADSDGDGVCDTDDLCAGGDDNIDVDSDGIPDDCDDQIGSDDPCEMVNIDVAGNTITVSNLDAPIFTIMVFNSQWQTVYNCGYTCTDPAVIDSLPAGDYHVSVKLYDNSWTQICAIMPTVNISGGSSAFVAGEEIFDFQAQRNGREVRVYWATNTEAKNDHFIVEHSFDGVNFRALMDFNSITEENGAFNYYETDKDPSLGTNFYRLKKVHHDGTSDYSVIRRVDFDIDLAQTALFPNPASKEVYISLEDFEGRAATISIYNQFGQRMDVQVIDAVISSPYRFDISQYAGGAYTMYIEMEGTKNFARKFIVSRL